MKKQQCWKKKEYRREMMIWDRSGLRDTMVKPRREREQKITSNIYVVEFFIRMTRPKLEGGKRLWFWYSNTNMIDCGRNCWINPGKIKPWNRKRKWFHHVLSTDTMSIRLFWLLISIISIKNFKKVKYHVNKFLILKLIYKK